VAVDDGNKVIIFLNTHTEVLEASLCLARVESIHEFVVLDLHTAWVDERHIVTVVVHNDRRYRSVCEQLPDPCFDVASWEVFGNAFSCLAEFAQTQDIQKIFLECLD